MLAVHIAGNVTARIAKAGVAFRSEMESNLTPTCKSTRLWYYRLYACETWEVYRDSKHRGPEESKDAKHEHAYS